MKVHITLKEGSDNKQCLAEIRRLGITNVNKRRLEKFGIITGDISATKKPLIKKLEYVLGITEDAEKYAWMDRHDKLSKELDQLQAKKAIDKNK